MVKIGKGLVQIHGENFLGPTSMRYIYGREPKSVLIITCHLLCCFDLCLAFVPNQFGKILLRKRHGRRADCVIACRYFHIVTTAIANTKSKGETRSCIISSSREQSRRTSTGICKKCKGSEGTKDSPQGQKVSPCTTSLNSLKRIFIEAPLRAVWRQRLSSSVYVWVLTIFFLEA